MEAVFGMVGLVSGCLKHLGEQLAFLLFNCCAPFDRTTHRSKTFQRFAKAGIIQMAASLEPNSKHSVVFAGSYDLKLMDGRGGFRFITWHYYVKYTILMNICLATVEELSSRIHHHG